MSQGLTCSVDSSPASAKQRQKIIPGGNSTCQGTEWHLQLWEVGVPFQAAKFRVSQGWGVQQWMDGLGTQHRA